MPKKPFRIAAITDEFAPDNLDRALDAMAGIGMTGAELRVVGGRNMIDLSNEEVEAVSRTVEGRGMTIVSLASPLLKFVLPDSPALDTRVQHDVFGSPYNYEDQPRLTARAFEIAERLGARIMRVFSYWRTVEPEKTFDRVAESLAALADEGARRGIVIGLENEHACNVGTGAEAGHLLGRVDHASVQLVWDPANAMILGERSYKDGYSKIPVERIVHVHAKDCVVSDHKPTWGPVGEMGVGWKEQIADLRRDGYEGWISLETHWPGPNGDKYQGSVICGRNLVAMAG